MKTMFFLFLALGFCSFVAAATSSLNLCMWSGGLSCVIGIVAAIKHERSGRTSLF